MNKEDYPKQEKVDFDNLDLPNAIRLVKLFNNSARHYFENWQECENKIQELEFELWLYKERTNK